MNSQPVNDRILVVSGGGSTGAWGAGFAKFLTDSFGEYNIAFGTSTGSLMNPLILLNRFDDLKKAYTTVTQKKIFNKNPFKKNGDLKWTVVFRILLGKNSFGESENLKKLIEEFLKVDDYKKIQELKKVFGVAVVDFKTGDLLLKFSNRIDDVAKMREWIWASSNQPLFMNYFTPKDSSSYYVDGGVRETVPVTAALEYAIYHHPEIKHIDVIINQPKYPIIHRDFKPTSIFKGLVRLTDIWRTEVVDNDVLIALQAASIHNCHDNDTITIHLNYFPSLLFSDNEKDLLFDPQKMKCLWNAGIMGQKDPDEDPGENFERPSKITICKEAARTFFTKRKKLKDRQQELINME
ncbi:MAG: patatin-like phospholipase family protein [Bacteroidota bacterium]|nr:patatin-like phospholipase family protein [Bacteroidota bacterium]